MPLRARDAGPGPRHPDVRRAPHLELPPLAVRVRRVRLHRDPLARLRAGRAAHRDRGVRAPASQIRRTLSNFASRILVAAVGLPLVLGMLWLRGWWVFSLPARASRGFLRPLLSP